MKDDLISRKQAQEAILKCDDMLLNFDKKVCEKALERVPAVDAVEVVRCIDCKHSRYMPESGMCYLHTEPCTNERGYKGEAVCVEPDDFCSYGERRQNND